VVSSIITLAKVSMKIRGDKKVNKRVLREEKINNGNLLNK